MDIDPAHLAHLKIGFASFAGALIRLFIRPMESLARSIWCTVACVLCGLYGTPGVVAYWAIPETYHGGVGAALGLLGLSVAESALRAVDRLDLGCALRRWMGR